jgi:RimJ/RimL family protein N-acetyltransferase
MDLAGADRLPLQTERLELRIPTRADAAAIHAYRSRADVCRYLPFEPQSTQRVEELVDGAQRPFTGPDPALWVVAHADGVVVGDAILFLRSVPHRGGEVGYVLAPEHRGRGYATELARGLVDLAFRTVGLHRVIGRLDARNVASARVLERAGLQREAHFIRNEWFKGEWADELVYAVRAEQWCSPGGGSPGRA